MQLFGIVCILILLLIVFVSMIFWGVKNNQAVKMQPCTNDTISREATLFNNRWSVSRPMRAIITGRRKSRETITERIIAENRGRIEAMLKNPEFLTGLLKYVKSPSNRLEQKIFTVIVDIGIESLLLHPSLKFTGTETADDLNNIRAALLNMKSAAKRGHQLTGFQSRAVTPILPIKIDDLIESGDLLLSMAADIDAGLLAEYTPQSMFLNVDIKMKESDCSTLCNVDQIYRRISDLGVCLQCISEARFPIVDCTQTCQEHISDEMVKRAILIIQALTESKTEQELQAALDEIANDWPVDKRNIVEEVFRQCLECRAEKGICGFPTTVTMDELQETITAFQENDISEVDLGTIKEKLKTSELFSFLQCMKDVFFPNVTPVYLQIANTTDFLSFDEPVYSVMPEQYKIPHEIQILKETTALELRFSAEPQPWYLLPLPINQKTFILCPVRFWTHCVHQSRIISGGGRVYLQSRTFSDTLNRLPLLRRDETDGTFYMTEITRSFGIGDVDGFPTWIPMNIANIGLQTALTRFTAVAVENSRQRRFNLLMNPYKKIDSFDRSSGTHRWTITELKTANIPGGTIKYTNLATSSANIWDFDIITRILLDLQAIRFTCIKEETTPAVKFEAFVKCFTVMFNSLRELPSPQIDLLLQVIPDYFTTCLKNMITDLQPDCTTATLNLMTTLLELVFTDTVMSWKLNVDQNTPLRMTDEVGDTMAVRVFPNTNSDPFMDGFIGNQIGNLVGNLIDFRDNGVTEDNVFEETEKRRFGKTNYVSYGTKWTLETSNNPEVVKSDGVLGMKLYPDGEMGFVGISFASAGFALGRAGELPATDPRHIYWYRTADAPPKDLLSVRVRRHRFTRELVIGILCQYAPPGVCVAPSHEQYEQLIAKTELLQYLLSECGGCTLSEKLAPFCDKPNPADCTVEERIAVFCRSSEARQLDAVVCAACTTVGFPCTDDNFCTITGSDKCNISYWTRNSNDRMFNIMPKAYATTNDLRFLYGTAVFSSYLPKWVQVSIIDVGLEVGSSSGKGMFPMQGVFFLQPHGSGFRLGNFRHLGFNLTGTTGGAHLSKNASDLTIEVVETGLESTFLFKNPANGLFLAYNGLGFEWTNDMYVIWAKWVFSRQTDAQVIPVDPIYTPNGTPSLTILPTGLPAPNAKLELQPYYTGPTSLGNYLEINARGTKNKVEYISPANGGGTDQLYRYWRGSGALYQIDSIYGYMKWSPYVYDEHDTKKYFYINGEFSGGAHSKRHDNAEVMGQGASNVIIVYPSNLFAIGYTDGTRTSVLSTSLTWVDANSYAAAFPQGPALFVSSFA